jgi:hypothetical protein
MKNIFLFAIACFFFTTTFAQANSDSLAYQLQRKKINAMLERRTQKFGQYDNSLSQHTGIFGLQTKKDIRRSNDILMDIVRTDNEIYKQLKILLDYSIFQQTQVLDKSKENEATTIAYMRNINKLRDQNKQLTKQLNELQLKDETTSRKLGTIIVFMLIVLMWMLWRNYSKRSAAIR